ALTLTPVLAVNAASISSSAFFIEAAAKTVRVFSSAQAGDRAAPQRMTKLSKNPARRCIVALQACLRDAAGARKSDVNLSAGAAGGAVPRVPQSLRLRRDFASQNNS